MFQRQTFFLYTVCKSFFIPPSIYKYIIMLVYINVNN
nr:MAG TPA: hypothetical protein [Caudoviricetes sp.]